MNGYPLSIALAVVNGLLAIVLILIKYAAAAHEKRDDERHSDMREEVGKLRDKVHDIGSKVAGMEMVMGRNHETRT